VLYAFHPLLNPPKTVLSTEEWQNDEFLETMFLESDTDMACVHSVPVFDAYHDGLVSVEKGALPGRAHGGRVVRAAPDVAATGARRRRSGLLTQ
jgi:hypothetical protein